MGSIPEPPGLKTAMVYSRYILSMRDKASTALGKSTGVLLHNGLDIPAYHRCLSFKHMKRHKTAQILLMRKRQFYKS